VTAKKYHFNLRLFHRRELPVPTRRGWVVLAVLLILFVWSGSRTVQPFLAVTDIQPGGLLAVAGWLDDYAIHAAVKEYRRGRYEGFFVTGVPLVKGAPLSEYRTYADLGAAVAVSFGMETDAVTAVPARDVQQDRTFASAKALKDWLDAHGRHPASVTVVSHGAHARRTRLLFQKALGSHVKVGVIAVPNQEYDPARWWASSAGVRDVIDETVAYLYARFLFRNSTESR